MKIHILTACFYPELHPRAFRAFELARSFARQGDEVEVTILTQVDGTDYTALQNEYGFRFRMIDLYHRRSGQIEQTGLHLSSKNRVKQKIYSIYRWLLEYLLAGNLFRYAPKIARQLEIAPDTDLFIALSTPFMNIYAGALYRRKHPLPNTRFIADSGDPFSGSEQTPRAFYMRWLERRVYKQYDFLAIPTPGAIPAYNRVIPKDKICIIPQGFDLESTPLATYKKNAIPTFAYAGVFYRDIRNPEFLLQYLEQQDRDFDFRIYLRNLDPYTETILDKYRKSLGEKLHIQYGVERDKLIYQLSQCDFLINVGNNNTTQLPSKLIDYGITKRPVFHCSAADFDVQQFEQFMTGDYRSAQPIDISPYAIRTITNQFKNLK
jgi:hypothetical protein